MNNAVFGKTTENVRKYRNIKLVKTDKKRNKLVSEPNYHTMKLIDDNLAIIEMKKVKVKMNKPIYLGLSILELCKIIMHEFMIMLRVNIWIIQDFAIWRRIAL